MCVLFPFEHFDHIKMILILIMKNNNNKNVHIFIMNKKGKT